MASSTNSPAASGPLAWLHDQPVSAGPMPQASRLPELDLISRAGPSGNAEAAAAITATIGHDEGLDC
ncbi:hypothetical protein VPNG_09823 [Cytospora leucostoma]|uniref:Uncharacterized protein n=1 Tax=Cytospora leucostoma TaxID=1230097 RepID=A0A423VM12_9PEZI|nr:hypothetical protein VPNG_09823 [Cytospora leucostoma]